MVALMVFSFTIGHTKKNNQNHKSYDSTAMT